MKNVQNIEDPDPLRDRISRSKGVEKSIKCAQFWFKTITNPAKKAQKARKSKHKSRKTTCPGPRSRNPATQARNRHIHLCSEPNMQNKPNYPKAKTTIMHYATKKYSKIRPPEGLKIKANLINSCPGPDPYDCVSIQYPIKEPSDPAKNRHAHIYHAKICKTNPISKIPIHFGRHLSTFNSVSSRAREASRL